MITLNGVTYKYKTYQRREGFMGSIKDFVHRESLETIAVKDINVNIKKGEIVGLLGKNGAGKTTLIKLMTGILEPSEGQISINDTDPFRKENHFLKEIGVVIGQKSQLIWDLPATETFRMLQVMYEIPESDYSDRLTTMLNLLNLTAKLNTPVRKLSLGERIKFEIVCSLIHNPKILFLDEPTIGLDITSQRNIREFLLKINREKSITIILTSHYMKDIEDLTEKILIIDDGEIIEDTTIFELKEKYSPQKCFKISFKYSIPPYLEHYISQNNTITVPMDDMSDVIRKLSDFNEIECILNDTHSFEDIIYDIFSGNGE